MLEILIWTLLGLIGLAAAVLAVPIDVGARFELGTRARLSLQFGWLFGLVRVRTELGARAADAPKKPKERRKKKRRGRRPSPSLIWRSIGLLGDLLGRIRIQRAELDIAVGTNDPAATGELAGYAAPLVALANALPRTRVSFMPDFTGSAIRGAGKGEIRMVPITLVPPLASFALSPEVRRWLLARR